MFERAAEYGMLTAMSACTTRSDDMVEHGRSLTEESGILGRSISLIKRFSQGVWYSQNQVRSAHLRVLGVGLHNSDDPARFAPFAVRPR